MTEWALVIGFLLKQSLSGREYFINLVKVISNLDYNKAKHTLELPFQGSYETRRDDKRRRGKNMSYNNL